MKVDFMIIGAQKCATTTLFQLLEEHPKLYGSSTKEPHFFSTSDDWKKGLEEYHSLFKKRKEGQLCFEGSTTYSFRPHRNETLWDDLQEYNPELKFIYLVRRPLHRIISAYMHAYERGYTDTDVVTALKEAPYFTDVTRYLYQLEPYIERFGAERILVIDFDDFNKKRTEALLRVTEFLGVDPIAEGSMAQKQANVSIGGNKRHKRYDQQTRMHRLVERYMPWLWKRLTDNSSRAFEERPEIPDAMKKEILSELEPDIVAMEEMLGKSLSHWREF